MEIESHDMEGTSNKDHSFPSRPVSLTLQNPKSNLPAAEDDNRHSWPPSGRQGPQLSSIKLKRQGRVEMKPNLKLKLEGRERIRQETKLVVLEYLSSLPSEKISARCRKDQRGPTSVVKARTIHSTGRPFYEVIERKKRSSITRRNSEEYDKNIRDKLKKMAYPLRQSLTPEILRDIKRFDRATFTTKDAKMKHSLGESSSDKLLDSPVASVTNRLDEMSQDIMKDYPQLLDEHLSELLTPLEAKEKLTYEEFSVVARSVFEKQFARFTGSIWTKIALVVYLVKEVLYSGNLTDIQVELLVDYSTRFITETSSEKIKKEGGWVKVALDPQSDVFIEQTILQPDIYNPLGNQVDAEVVDGPPAVIERPLSNDSTTEASYLGMARDAVREWTTYGAAALAVGIGFAYAYLKQQ